MGNREHIVEILKEKASLNQLVYEKTLSVFSELKDTLQEYSVEANEMLEGSERRIRFVYQDRGKFEAQVQIASDVLFFSMHTNVFTFDRGKSVWKSDYIISDKTNAYCGIINIYNFLADSLKYNRSEDQGYLVARIFINKEGKYMVEGKRQTKMPHGHFSDEPITEEILITIFENAISYSVTEFDLLVPPYDYSKLVTLEQINTKIDHSKIRTGKRLGFDFCSDDI